MSTQVISSGVTSSGLHVGSGVKLEVLSGGVATGTYVDSGGSLYVSAGGVAETTLLMSGAVERLYGIDSGLGQLGAASATVFGSQVVEAGGVALSQYVGATVTRTLDGDDAYPQSHIPGVQDVFGSAGLTVLAGGEQIVESGGTASAVRIRGGGYEYVASGGTAQGVAVSSGGTLYVAPGASLTTVTVSSGAVLFTSDATAIRNLKVESGGVVESSTTVSAGETTTGFVAYDPLAQFVSGTAVNTYVSGGEQVVDSGGVARGTVLTGDYNVYFGRGGQYVLSGTAVNTLVSGGYQLLGGVAHGVTLVGDGVNLGLEDDYGLAANVVISSGGDQWVDGGSAVNVTILDGGTQTVVDAHATRVVVGLGGQETLGEHTHVTSLTIDGGGAVTLDNGGDINRVTVSSGGMVVLLAGGVTSATFQTGAIIDMVRRDITSAAVDPTYQQIDLYGDGRLVKKIGLANDGAGLSFAFQSDGQGGTDVIISSGGTEDAAPGAASLIAAAAGLSDTRHVVTARTASAAAASETLLATPAHLHASQM